MSEMPARIRVAQDADGFWTCREAISGSPEFVRADIAERMAEALDEICRGLADSGSSPVRRTTLMTKQAAYKIARSALSAWKDGR